jgi:hypothetical protein
MELESGRRGGERIESLATKAAGPTAVAGRKS